jgi:hypothetical protein
VLRDLSADLFLIRTGGSFQEKYKSVSGCSSED